MIIFWDSVFSLEDQNTSV